MIAAELATMPHGGDRSEKSKGQNCPLTTEAAAKQLNVSPMTVKIAKAVKKADPVLAEEVKQGKTKLSTAAKKTGHAEGRDGEKGTHECRAKTP
jgi:cytochrome c556